MAAPQEASGEVELLEAQLAAVRRLTAGCRNSGSLVGCTVALYSDLLDGLVVDIALEAHRAARFGDEAAPPSGAPHIAGGCASDAPVPLAQARAGADVFGATHAAVPVDEVACPSCARCVQAGRFAAHLEKCLGKGRSAARATATRGAGGAGPVQVYVPSWTPKRDHKKKQRIDGGAAVTAVAKAAAPLQLQPSEALAPFTWRGGSLPAVRISAAPSVAQRLAPTDSATPTASSHAPGAADDAFAPLPLAARGARPPRARMTDVVTWQPLAGRPPPQYRPQSTPAGVQLLPPWLGAPGPVPIGAVAPGLPPPLPALLSPLLPPGVLPMAPRLLSPRRLLAPAPPFQHALLPPPPPRSRNGAPSGGGKSQDGRRRKELRTMLAAAVSLADLRAYAQAPPMEPLSPAARAIHAAAAGFRAVDADALALGGLANGGDEGVHGGERDVSVVLRNMCSIVSQRSGTLGRLCSNGLGCSNHREPARAALRALLLPNSKLPVAPPHAVPAEVRTAAAFVPDVARIRSPPPPPAFSLVPGYTPALELPPLALPPPSPLPFAVLEAGLTFSSGGAPVDAQARGRHDSDGDDALLLPPGAGGGALMGAHDDALFMLC